MKPQQFTTPVTALSHVIITSSRYKRAVHPLARKIAERIRAYGAEITEDLEGRLPLADVAPTADLVICFGGDGTLLSAARRLVGVSIPTIGVNLGKLGFLAEHSAEELMAYVQGEPPRGWQLTPKMMLQLTLTSSFDAPIVRYALNDVIVAQGVMTRLISIDMHVDGQQATEYRADGLVISTPVGSTAYSLSLGGPILSSGLQCFVITPIAPHTLTNRPIVISGESQASFQVRGSFDQLALVLDGQERIDLELGDTFTVQAAPTSLVLISSGKRSYFDILREKLAWGEHPNLLRDHDSF